MKRKFGIFVILILMFASVQVFAETLNAKVLLPDGNGAPFATVSVGDAVFTANNEGNVTLDVPSDVKILKVNWLELSAELPVGETLKFKNKTLYGAPYSKDDFLINGPDVWEITDTEIIAVEGSETQLFYEDAFDNTVFRAKFTLDNAAQWYYVRFFTRLYDPGFNGYSLNFPGVGDSYFARYEGNWDQYSDIPPTFLGVPGKVKVECETVMFSEDETITVYYRETSQDSYRKIYSVVDDSVEAYYDGGFAIMCSYLSLKITELGVFSF